MMNDSAIFIDLCQDDDCEIKFRLFYSTKQLYFPIQKVTKPENQ